MEKTFQKFKKKEIIEAVQFKRTPEGIKELKEFAGYFLGQIRTQFSNPEIAEVPLLYSDEEGVTQLRGIVLEGDWILKNKEGEYYVWDKETFAKTYETIE